MSPHPSRLSGLIREARLALEPPMTQEALAAAVGVTQPSVSAWEHDTAQPALSSLVALADVLDLNLAELFEALKAPA